MKTLENARVELHRALSRMRLDVETAFAHGEIHTELDLNVVVVCSLKERLRPSSGRSHWIIGNNHAFAGARPDVCCYFVNCSFGDFVAEKDQCLAGVVEIKFAAPLKGDLKKLSFYQRKKTGLIAWMVYGDHFCEEIHAHYGREGHHRMEQIDEWVSESPATRGRTILNCGDLHKRRRFRIHRESIVAFNDNYWIRDRK